MNKKILSLLVVLLSGFAFAACGIDEAWITPESKIVKNDTVAAHHDKEVAADDAPCQSATHPSLEDTSTEWLFTKTLTPKAFSTKKRCSTSHSCAKATMETPQKVATLYFA